MTNKLATLGNGCFWCTEAVFQKLKGVISVRSGFSGGAIKNPAYREVVTGRTGHAEVLHISYDDSLISFSKLLEVFFATHDPTTLNRQGNDIGTQYRSAIFYHNEAQNKIASEFITELTKASVFHDEIVTEVVPFEAFYPAEAYHDNYFEGHQEEPYCKLVINPKLQKFLKNFAGDLK
ncbi:peptide-methionine (S)-S-oxide reductase MsrA [Flavicella sediminum]|uniref:peptide-methionine (S)-S-oxide reductase MsrA n=1 Tax=Flavicella sediminum TaxID=2585141 RepID=UPI00111DE721|nr:peptide-methionine (S)-S-oxide reductase MsrA [Flavicella sediminum]